MSKIAILTDSTSALTKEKAKEYNNLFMIPLQVIFDTDDVYLDGETITIKEFFEKSEELYTTKGIVPTTSQASIGKCIEVYEELLKDFDEIIYFTISEKMSGTYQSGVLAAEEFDNKITVINSATTSAPLLMTAIKAAELANAGNSKEEILEKVKPIYEDSKVYFVVSDLIHLQRTGRIGAAATVIGNALQLKPVLGVLNGEVTAIEKVRNINKAHKKVLSYVEELDINSKDLVSVVSGDADEYSTKFCEYIRTLNDDVNIFETTLSPVIGVNTGPGLIGVVVTKGFYDIK